MKGANRKLFRKPGLARQAIGILASSNELADQVQSVAPNMMPRQPVQKFNTGGLASLLGITPAGYEMVDDKLTARPGFSGMYERMSGISDPARAREQSGIDLMKLGARIAAGQSGSTTTNVAQALTTTLDEVGKNRQTEFAMTLKEAEMARALEDAKATKDYRAATLRLSGMPSALKEAVTGTGGAITSQGQIMGSDGTIYPTPEAYQASLGPEQKARYDTFFVQGTDTETRELARLKDPATPYLQKYEVILNRAGSADPDQYETAVIGGLRAYAGAKRVTKSGVDRILAEAGKQLKGANLDRITDADGAFIVNDPNTNTTYFHDPVSGTLLFEVQNPEPASVEKAPSIDDPKDDSKDPPATDPRYGGPEDPDALNPNLSELSSAPELAEIAADLQLTNAEQARIQEDPSLRRATQALKKAEENLQATLDGTRKLDVAAIEKNIERHKRTIEKRLRELYAKVPNQRRTRISRNRRPPNKSVDSILTAQEDTTTGG